MLGRLFGTDRRLLGDDLVRWFIAVSVTLTCLGTYVIIYRTERSRVVFHWRRAHSSVARKRNQHWRLRKEHE